MIDEQMSDKYTLDGCKHPITGVVDLQYSMQHLLSECKLQYLGTQLGVTVDLTPKFHAELVGEGVEYYWAHARHNTDVFQSREREDARTSKSLSKSVLHLLRYLQKKELRNLLRRLVHIYALTITWNKCEKCLLLHLEQL
jgi:hypothetical protein